MTQSAKPYEAPSVEEIPTGGCPIETASMISGPIDVE